MVILDLQKMQSPSANDRIPVGSHASNCCSCLSIVSC